MGKLWCDTCYSTGEVDCFCGGDLCVCMNYGSEPCPDCDGGSLLSDEADGWEEFEELLQSPDPAAEPSR